MSRVSVRYIINDVPEALRFYTALLGFTVERDASPAFASLVWDGPEIRRCWGTSVSTLVRARAAHGCLRITRSSIDPFHILGPGWCRRFLISVM